MTYHKSVFAIKVYNVEACNLASTIHFGQVLAHSTHTMVQCQCLKIQQRKNKENKNLQEQNIPNQFRDAVILVEYRIVLISNKYSRSVDSNLYTC